MISNGYNLLSTLAANSSLLSNQLAQAEAQVSTGHVSSTYSGLGNQAEASLNLNPQISHLATYSSNIDAAQGRLSVTQSALSSISTIASNFYAQLNTLSSSDPANVQTIANSASAALQQIGGLLNSKSGGVYVFAGQDTSNPPIPNTDPTVMASSLLSPTASANSPPFSSTLGTSVPEVEVSEGNWVQVGVLANSNTLAASAGTTTGSYMRDTMTALANLANLSPTSPNFASTVSTTRGYLTSAISAMSSEVGSLGNIESSLTATQTNLQSMSTSLQTQLSSVQDVDMASAISKSSALQTQLQASYQIIGQVKGLSLATYL